MVKLTVILAGLIIIYPKLNEKTRYKLNVLSRGNKLSKLFFLILIIFALMEDLVLGCMLMILYFTLQSKNKLKDLLILTKLYEQLVLLKV